MVLVDGFHNRNRPCNEVQRKRAQAPRRFHLQADRSWKQVLSNDAPGSVLSGSRFNLVHAVKTGGDVRSVQGDTVRGHVYKAQNLAFSPDGNHVAAQALLK